MAVHFVGFRGDEYNRARRVFGEPDFVHRDWDVRAQSEMVPGDVCVFGPKANPDKPPHWRSHNDSQER